MNGATLGTAIRRQVIHAIGERGSVNEFQDITETYGKLNFLGCFKGGKHNLKNISQASRTKSWPLTLDRAGPRRSWSLA